MAGVGSMSNKALSEAIASARQLIGGGGSPQAVEQALFPLLAMHCDDACVHELAAWHFLKLGMGPNALRHARLATAMAGGTESTAVLYCSLGRVFNALGCHDDAVDCFSRAICCAPDMFEAWQLLGYMQVGIGQWEEGRNSLREALCLSPDDVGTLEMLVDVELDHGFPADALPLTQRLCIAKPNDPDAMLKHGVILGRLFMHGQAVEHYQDALSRMPDAPDLWMAMGQSLEYVGDAAASEDAYRQAMQLRKGWAMPLSALIALNRKCPDPVLIEEGECLLGAPGTLAADRSILGYEIGKTLDAQGYHARAMEVWKVANKARQEATGPYQSSQLDELVQNTLAAFASPSGIGDTPSPACNPRIGEPTMIFVVGMPRSGTTLVEQIINSHPIAHGCGELLDLTLLANGLRGARGSRWPEALHDMLEVDIQDAATAYMVSAMRQAAPDIGFLVDKAPLNFFFLGLAAKLFPTAKVLWCRRDPRDVAISVYGENFSLDAAFATDWQGITDYMRAERVLMDMWTRVLPLPIRSIAYEALVSDPEREARAMLDFIGLPWDSACLHFHENGSTVQTPSRWQVRQPINGRSVGRWRNYPEIAEMIVGNLAS